MLRRIAPAVLATAVIAAALTGCSSADAGVVDRTGCEPSLAPGAVSDSVVVLGGWGAEPKLSIPKDAEISVSQRSIIDSSGVAQRPKLADGDAIVTLNFVIYEQTTGEELYRTEGFAGASDNRRNDFFLLSSEFSSPLVESVRCAAPGERVVLAMTQIDSVLLHQQIGGDIESGVVVVLDIEAVSPLHAEGSLRGLPNGFPAVVTDSTGRPGIVLPPRDAPVGSTASVRIAGDGPEVDASDAIVAQVLTVAWDGTVLSSTWADGGPQLLEAEQAVQMQELNFRFELTGKRVGSQVVITEGGDSARVHVVDILAIG